MEASRRIGILGGTFNPVHLGHLIMAQCALEAFDLSTVLFVPCATPPHKDARALLPACDRLAMLETALEADPRFEACDVEIRRGGVSYAVDTVRELRRQYTGDSLHFIIGADSLAELSSWKSVYDILSLCHVVTVSRPGFDLARLKPSDLDLARPWPERLLQNLVSGCLIDISSSDIRHRVAEGLSIRYLVPEPVEMYIAEHNLYRR